MNIAFFSDTYFPTVDGVVMAMETFRREFEKKGHEVYIFCPGKKEDKKKNKDPHVFYHTSATFKPYPDYKLALFPFFSISKIKKLDINIIHSHALATMGLAGYMASKSLKKPNISTFHTLVPDATHYISKKKIVNKVTKKAVWGYCTWYYNLFDKVTTPSRYMQNKLAEHGIGADVYPNGIDIAKFRYTNPKKIKKELGIEKNKIALHVGRLVKEKNIDLIIDSARLIEKRIPNIKFIIVGKGPAEKYYKQKITKEGLEHLFLFTGHLDQNKLPPLYSAADVYMFPSTFDTQGLVAEEAMACGAPIIGVKDSAVEEVIDSGKNGYLFNNNQKSFTDALIKAMKFKTPLRASRKTAENYSKEKMAKKMLGLYEGMIRK